MMFESPSVCPAAAENSDDCRKNRRRGEGQSDLYFAVSPNLSQIQGPKEPAGKGPTMANVTAMLETVNDRMRNSPGSNRGSGCFDDRRRNKGSNNAVPAKHAIVYGESQPQLRPRRVPSTTRNTEALPMSTPRRSSGLSDLVSAVSSKYSLAP